MQLKKRTSVGLLVAGLVVLCVQLATPAFANERPEMTAQALDQAPQLDGEVRNDPTWQVQPATGFTQIRPFAGQPSTQRTEVFVGYTDSALYVAVVCYDDNPAGIVVGDSRRDASLADIDSFQLVIDAFQDEQNGFVFGTSPSAMEYDGQLTNKAGGGFGSAGGTFNLNWDTTWTVKSQIGDYGWSAEMEIPFKSLRYGAGDVQTWGINFQRNIRRNNEVSFWAPLERQFNILRVSDAGRLTQVSPPANRNLLFTPYALGLARRGGERDGTDYEEEFGFDAKYSITPSLVLDVTYNTDFAQVEVDEIQVNLNRFSLFFPEKRPFFLENAGQFTVGSPREVELFFSRRIGVGNDGVQTPIDGGMRLSGKVGDATNVGFLHMRAEGVDGLTPQNDFTVARVNQEFGNRSTLGAIFVQREGDGSINGDEDADYNRTYAIDGQLGIGDALTLSSYIAKTETPGLRGEDFAYRVFGRYDSETLTGQGGYTRVGENFNPEVGFLRRSNYQKGEFFVLRRYRPDDWLGFYELRPHIAFSGFWDDEGFWESGFLHIDNHWEWRNGYEIHTGYNFLHEGVQETFEINPGTFVLPGDYDDSETQFVVETDEAKALSFEVEWKHGGFFDGDRDAVEASVKYRFGDKFSSELGWNYNDIDLPVENGDFEVNVGRLRLSYSFTPKVLLQALVQYDDRSDLVATNIRFSWLQSANTGLYIVYNEVDDDTVRGPIEKRREFAIKYSRIFDLI